MCTRSHAPLLPGPFWTHQPRSTHISHTLTRAFSYLSRCSVAACSEGEREKERHRARGRQRREERLHRLSQIDIWLCRVPRQPSAYEIPPETDDKTSFDEAGGGFCLNSQLPFLSWWSQSGGFHWDADEIWRHANFLRRYAKPCCNSTFKPSLCKLSAMRDPRFSRNRELSETSRIVLAVVPFAARENVGVSVDLLSFRIDFVFFFFCCRTRLKVMVCWFSHR